MSTWQLAFNELNRKPRKRAGIKDSVVMPARSFIQNSAFLSEPTVSQCTELRPECLKGSIICAILHCYDLKNRA